MEYNAAVKSSSTLVKLREALAATSRVAVQVALDSGPCWAFAVRVDERRGAVRVHIEIAGARVLVAAEQVLGVVS